MLIQPIFQQNDGSRCVRCGSHLEKGAMICPQCHTAVDRKNSFLSRFSLRTLDSIILALVAGLILGLLFFY